MSRLTSICFSFIVLALIIAAPGNAEMDSKTAVGVWLLDEGGGEVAKDSSGNRNHGTLQGGPDWIDGRIGSALSFNGKTSRVVIPDNDSLDLQEAWTITAWVFVNESEDSYGQMTTYKREG